MLWIIMTPLTSLMFSLVVETIFGFYVDAVDNNEYLVLENNI